MTDLENKEQQDAPAPEATEQQPTIDLNSIKTGDLINAGNDMTKVLQLDPPIATVLDVPPKAKAKVKQEAEAVFRESLIGEILEVITGKDPDTDRYIVEAGDMPSLEESSRGIIKLIAPSEVDRLFPPQKTREASSGKKSGVSKTKKPSQPKASKYSRIDASVQAIANLPNATIAELAKEADSLYVANGNPGKENDAESTLVTKMAVKIFAAIRSVGFTVQSPPPMLKVVETEPAEGN